MKTAAIAITFFLSLYACRSDASRNEAISPGTNSAANQPNRSAAGRAAVAEEENITPTSSVQTAPRNVRDFFMLLPEKYFVLEGCEREKDKDCKKAREQYLKQFGEVDIANGYIKGLCDGGQACIEMAIFKRPDNTYLVGVSTFAEMMNDYYFLDYSAGKWKDVSADAVPQFSKKNMYELPRNGTTVQVFAKKIIEQGPDFEASEKGRKLYDLVWNDEKFTIKK